MNNAAQLAPRYEALFRVSDCLSAHQDLPNLFRALPGQLQPVLDFDYMSIFANAESASGACWYVPETNSSALTLAREVPIERVHVSWAFENQQPAVIADLDEETRFSGANRLLSHRGLRSACAIALTTGHRRLGMMFLGSERPGLYSEESLQFLSFVAGRVALAIDNVISRHTRHHQDPNDNLHKLAVREEVAPVFDEIVGSSEPLDEVLDYVTKVAPTDSTVLITGESGTGKELIARAIHQRSNRSGKPFIRVNCSAIPASLIASELFGHEKGSFTGATQRHLGRFELAHGGTIFLDEIGDIPAETQVALLRVLQEREIERVGGAQPIPVDVRVLAATNSDLGAAVSAGIFRMDLYYRLNVFPIHMPPLRERTDDILALARHFIELYATKTKKKFRTIDRQSLECLQSYEWPGNVRELQNVVERSVILCNGDTFSIDERWMRQEQRRAPQQPATIAAALVNQEKQLIEAALEESRGRIAGPFGAAGKLGMPRTTLQSKIKNLQINKSQFKCA